MAAKLNQESWLSRLEPIKYDGEASEEQANLEQMGLASALLTIAGITPEQEFNLCRDVALHLLGELNEPEDIVLE